MRTTSRVIINIFDGVADDALATAIDMSLLLPSRMGTLRYAIGFPDIGGPSESDVDEYSLAMPDKTLSTLRRCAVPRLHMDSPPPAPAPHRSLSSLRSHPLGAGTTAPAAEFPTEPFREPSPKRHEAILSHAADHTQFSWRRQALEDWSPHTEPPRQPSPPRHVHRISNFMRKIGWTMDADSRGEQKLLNEVPRWQLHDGGSMQRDEPSGSTPARR